MQIQRCPSTVTVRVSWARGSTYEEYYYWRRCAATNNPSLKTGRGGPRLSFGLKEADLESAQLEFPEHDVEKLLPRFIEVNNDKDGGKAASKNPLKWLKGFLKNQKGGKDNGKNGAVAESGHKRDLSKLPVLTLEYGKKDLECEDPIWKIGKKYFQDDEHIEEMRNMSQQPKASAHQWLCKLVDCEWNTDAAFEEFGAGDLFYCDNETVEGVRAFECRDAVRRESEKVKNLSSVSKSRKKMLSRRNLYNHRNLNIKGSIASGQMI